VKSLRIKETKEIFHQRSLIVSGRRHVRFTVASARQRYDMEIVREIVAERGIDPSPAKSTTGSPFPPKSMN
jgi:hypothetical protein